MKNLFIPSILLVLIHHVGFGQIGDKQYLDKNCFPVADSSKAVYYRLIDYDNDPLLVRDYFITGELEMMAECSAVVPKVVKDGDAAFFYKNGTLKQECRYKSNMLVGLSKMFYENGQQKDIRFYEDRKLWIYQAWNERGEPLLENGTGQVSERLEEKGSTNTLVVVDSVVIRSFDIKDGSVDTVYSLVENLPEYKNGYDALARDLSANIKYPKAARKNGIEGTVYVQFVVGPDGQVNNPLTLRGIDAECDAVAVSAVAKLNKWKPGEAGGKRVAVRYVLPVKFKLR